MKKLRVMSIMAHQDDFEFEAAGFFAMLRRHYGDDVELKILTTSRGASGHHVHSIDETAAIREKEARASAELVGAEYENLVQLDGSHIHMQVFCDRNMLGGLWNAIRAFGPDYIIAPPVVTNPLAGIHIDHQHTAEAVRLVAYQLGVPNAYPTMNAPRITRFAPPIVLACIDSYSQEAIWHFRVDVEPVRETKIKMLQCHQSQIMEWLPFVDNLREDPDKVVPMTTEQWLARIDKRHQQRNRLCGFDETTWHEYFAITNWGASGGQTPGGLEKLKADFPFISVAP